MTHPDSAIEAVADALETRCCSFSDGDGSLGYGYARKEYKRVAKELLAAAYPEPTKDELKKCREGGQDCLRCQAMLDAGLNPHTGESLESAAYPEQTECRLPRKGPPPPPPPPKTPGTEDVGRRSYPEQTEGEPTIEFGLGQYQMEQDQSGRRGASQPVDEVEAEAIYWHREYEKLRASLTAAEQRANLAEAKWVKEKQRAEIARGNTKREYDRAAQLVHQVKVAEADRDRLQRERDEARAVIARFEPVLERDPRYLAMKSKAEAAKADRDRLQRELDSPERDKALQIVIDQTRAEREAFRADRDRLQRELDEWKEGYENLEWSVQTLSPLVARVKALEGALSMLVELKDMQEHEHDRYESVEGKVAKRDAWQAARAALKGEQS